MRFALVNPNWYYDGSVFLGCREPHLPLEYGYMKAILERKKHEVTILDAHLDNLSLRDLREALIRIAPHFTVITTAPSYLYWRCPPPELRVPQETINELHDVAGCMVAVGPHGSTTPASTLRKLGVELVVIGECEEVVGALADKPKSKWKDINSICYRSAGEIVVQGPPGAVNMGTLPPIPWPKEMLDRHVHQHHRFDPRSSGLGAEMEASRGCPYSCSFCAKDNFRNKYRKRPLATVMKELDNLVRLGVDYVYFIDEIFLPDKELLAALAEKDIKFGMQTRIDLWNREAIDLLGKAGCVSIEAGVESISEKGRLHLNKQYIISTELATEYLIYAKKRIPFVQATLIDSRMDSQEAVENWRQYLQHFGVWANKPVPLFPYPGSQEYVKLWGEPDDHAWERAHEYYLSTYPEFTDAQGDKLLRLTDLEVRSIHEQRMRINN